MIERLINLPTLKVNPDIELSLTYRGRRYKGLSGDSIATALYANNIRIFSRSLKYHRPRGLFSLDGECSNCLMNVDDIPNVRAETTLLKNNTRVSPQNVVGTPERDLMSFIDRLDRLMPAGFYYHYFHRPYRLWPFFQNRLRRAAGLGRIKQSFRMEGIYDQIYPSADVCVIGAGPAGMRVRITRRSVARGA